MHKPLNVLALPGSLRRASWNRLLLQAAAAHAPSGMSVEIYAHVDAIPPFNEELEGPDARGPVAVRDLRERVREADGLLISTPEYNQSLPGVLKNVLDWLSRPAPDEVLKDKPVAIMGASSGRWGTRLAQAALRQVLHATEAIVIPQPALYVREAAQLFDETGRVTDASIQRTLDEILRALSSSIRMHQSTTSL
jgi:chromate reductase, NAD(P)H dehydrogenase (quinone)